MAYMAHTLGQQEGIEEGRKQRQKEVDNDKRIADDNIERVVTNLIDVDEVKTQIRELKREIVDLKHSREQAKMTQYARSN